MTTPMTAERLTELREAAKKATPGPWRWYAFRPDAKAYEADNDFGYKLEGPPESAHEGPFARRADAQLAAAAPELLTEVARLRAENLRLTVAADPSKVGKVGELVASVTRLVRIERDSARAEADRLRPMEAVLASAEAQGAEFFSRMTATALLHQPVRYAKDRPPNCSAECRNEHGQPATWPCPTRVALDGGA